MIADAVNINDDVGRQRLCKEALKERDHRAKWNGRRVMWKAFFAVGFWLGVGLGGVLGGVLGDESQWRVWLEPKFMHAPVVGAITGAERTEWVAGERQEGEDVYLAKEPFARLKVSWEQFFEKARLNADRDLAELTPQWVRNAKKVIEYGELSSEQPVVASAVLGSKLLERFEPMLGEKLLVVVPNRYTAFIFPALVSSYQEYTPMVTRAYHETAFPVSLEVFEVSAKGWRAVGIYEEP